MAAFMGKDVKKLKGKGGGKVSTSTNTRFPVMYYDLILKTLRNVSCMSHLIVKKTLLNGLFAVEVHVRARHA